RSGGVPAPRDRRDPRHSGRDVEGAPLRGQARAAIGPGRRSGEDAVKHNPTDEELSAAARDLRREWESPELWPRIAAALAEESRRAERRRAFFAAPAWRGLLAAAAVLLLAVTASLTLWPRAGAPEAEAQRRLLTEKALHEVERAEGDYVQSIED